VLKARALGLTCTDVRAPLVSVGAPDDQGVVVAEDWNAVAAAIDERIADLGVQLQAVAERSQVSESTIRELRYNTQRRKRSARTLESVSIALEWERDHLSNVLGGQSPSGNQPTDMARLRSRVDSLDEKVERLAAGVEENNRLMREVIGRLDHLASDRDVSG
jgi:flagellar biosynthesis/type III secretory pathway chaperone